MDSGQLMGDSKSKSWVRDTWKDMFFEVRAMSIHDIVTVYSFDALAPTGEGSSVGRARALPYYSTRRAVPEIGLGSVPCFHPRR
jgi:hypothetical protein